MAFVVFNPSPRQVPPPPAEKSIHIPPPHKLKDEAKTSMLRTALPFLIIGVMAVMIVVMLMSGMFRTGRSPMMMMRFMMMGMLLPVGMMAGMGFMGGGGSSGNSVAELNHARRNSDLALDQLRKTTHQAGRWVHALCQDNYPDPMALLGRIPVPVGDRVVGSMWQAVPGDEDDVVVPGERLTKNPYRTARVGTGLVPVVPKPTWDTQEILDNLEPVTAMSFHRFRETQSVVADCGVGVNFADADVHALRGDPARRLDLARAMICSLAFNHVPGDLQIGLISDAAESEWGWLKWLPHTADTDRRHDGLMPRLAWRSLSEFFTEYQVSIDDRIEQNGVDSTFLIVIVDLPDSEVSWPPGRPPRIPGVSFLVVRAGGDRISEPENWWKVDDKGILNTAHALAFATADRMSRAEAQRFSRAIGSYVPPGFGQLSGAAVREANSQLAVPGIFDALKVRDWDTYDIVATWNKNEWTETLDAPFGNRFDHGKGVKLPIVETLNIIEDSLGGTGPHGFVQGVSGAGKSVLLRAYVIALATLYSPSKINFILMDYKGGTTFFNFDKLPHTIANISNLREASDLTERMIDVIKGELESRQELLNRYKNYGVVDIHTYRAAMRKHPDMPPLPYLLLIIDEFREAKEADKKTLQVLFSVAARGRGLGMHILACSQFIDQGLVGELKENATFGISLKSRSSAGSQLVVGSTKPMNIERNGEAIIWKLDEDSNRVTNTCMAFNIIAGYVKKTTVGSAIGPSGTGAGDAVGTDDDIVRVFNLLNRPGEALDISKKDDTEVEETVKTDNRIVDVMLSRLEANRDVVARPLWQPPLSIPMTLNDVSDLAAAPEDGTLPIRLGDTDVPYEHARLPFILDLTDGTGHGKIIGRPKSGRSTAICTMVVSSLIRYRNRINWYLVEYSGSKLGDVMHCPNVGGYATRTDTDLIDRYFGEFRIIHDIRRRMLGQYKMSLDQYLDAKRNRTLPAVLTPEDAAEVSRVDHYEHMVIVLDGYQAMVSDDDSWKTERLSWLLADGGASGLHLIVTVNSNVDLSTRIENRFSGVVQMAVDANDQSVVVRGDARAAVDAIPKGQPGRAADLVRQKSALIMLPMTAPLISTETDESGKPVYNYRTDYQTQVRSLCAELKTSYPDVQAPPIRTAPDRYSFADMWQAFGPYVNRDDLPFRRFIPLGMSTSTLRLTVLPPEQPTTHLMITGDQRTGKTAALRGIMHSLTRIMSPEECQIICIDPSYGLLEDVEELKKSGYIKDGRVAVSRAESDVIMANLVKIIKNRMPDSGDMDVATRRDRSWFKGPDVFVIIDNYHQIKVGGFGGDSPVAELEKVLRNNPQCGVHFILSSQAAGFSGIVNNDKLGKVLLELRTPILMLSGSEGEGALWPRGPRFTLRRAGRAMLVKENSSTGDVIQIAYMPPLSGEDAQQVSAAMPDAIAAPTSLPADSPEPSVTDGDDGSMPPPMPGGGSGPTPGMGA